MSLTNIFHSKFKNNAWSSKESVSGAGSELDTTKDLRIGLQNLLKKYNIKTMLDAPCGDFNWVKEMDLSNIEYIGGDIVPEIIEKNKSLYNFDFKVINIITDKIPDVDLLLVRDCLVHLSNDNILKFIENVKNSNVKYLLTTSFTDKNLGHDWRKSVLNANIPDGGWRPINLEIEPYKLTNPIDIIIENCAEDYPNYTDKSLLLYNIN
jgi:hypothetical protein